MPKLRPKSLLPQIEDTMLGLGQIKNVSYVWGIKAKAVTHRMVNVIP